MKPPVFLTRSFDVVDAGKTLPLTLQLYWPVRSPRGFACQYRVTAGRRRAALRTIYGEDGIQSLLLALSMIVTEIELAARNLGGRIPRYQMLDFGKLRPKGVPRQSARTTRAPGSASS